MPSPPSIHPTARVVPERWYLPLLLAVTAAAYVGVTQAGFVWDDAPLVLRNELTGDLANIPQFFAMDLWDGSPVEKGVSGYYRPLMLLSLAVDRWLYGLNPMGHHLHGLAWHLLAVAVLYRMLSRLLGAGPALLAATVFGLHPVQSEAVVWVAARNDPMAAALGFAALNQLVGRPFSRGRALAAAVLTALAGFTKESVVLLPGLLLCLDLASPPSQQKWRRYLPIFAGIGVVGLARLVAGVGASSAPPPEGWEILGRTSWRVVGVLAGLVVWPSPLSSAHSLEWIDREPVWRLAIGFLGLAGWGLAMWRRQSKAAVAGGIWLVCCLVPVVVPIADKGWVGERYLYLGLAGLGLSLGVLMGRWAAATAAVVAIPSLLLLHSRLPDWASDVDLWASAVRATPSPHSYGALGHALRERGNNEAALGAFERALSDPSPDRSVCRVYVGTALAMGAPERAAANGDQALGWGCDRGVQAGRFNGHYAVALAFSGRWDDVAERVSLDLVDSDRRLDVAAGALYRHQADDDAYTELRAAWDDGVALDRQVQRVLDYRAQMEAGR